MISRQVKTVGVGGVVLGIACVGVGVWFTMALTKSQQKKSELTSAFSELERLCDKKNFFPNADNIAKMSENRQTLEAWVVAATNQLAKSDVPLTAATPAGFKSDLEDAIREMVRQSEVQGRPARVAPDFRFGFDKYKGEVLPETADVPRLHQQLDIIKLLVAELYGANVVKLEAVTREVFESGGAPEAAAPAARRKNRPSGGGAAATAAKPSAASADGAFESQRFTVAFQAYPDTFAEVLNRMAVMDIFVVVSEVDVKKGDLKKEAAATAAAKPPVAAQPADEDAPPPVAQVVTNPPDEPPVSVRLVLDVYSFKGV